MQAHQPAQHCRSYYAATINDQTRHPRLEGDIEADVCVIGGGFSGVATALTLAERGVSVALLEAKRIGWGASGRNGGQLIGGLLSEQRLTSAWGPDANRIIRTLRYRGHEIIEERIARYAIECDYRLGAITAAAKPGHMRKLEKELAKAGNNSSHLDLVDRQTVRDLLGTEHYHGGLIDRRDAHLHPLNLVLGEARAAASQGVRLYEESPVSAIEHEARPVVKTDHGQVRANHVVIAGNAYHQLERSHIGGYLFPAGTYVIATEPLAPETIARINPENLAVIDSNLVIDYFRLSADHRMLFGGLCHYANRDPASITGALMPRLCRIYPQFADVKVDYEWGGRIGITLTRVPLIRRIETNVMVLQGYSGHGIGVTHIAAEIIAEAIVGDTERLALFEKIGQFRVPTSQWLGNQILALGMAWYRLRDRLS